jgi:AcrR family transcriptional regulator
VPKQVDHGQRRQQIAQALLEVAAAHGLEGVSLRHVAAQAGVTSGMVQHYFPSKNEMLTFAMRSASARYASRMATALEGLGPAPDPRAVVVAVLTALLPRDDQQRQDARVALAFQSYAATRPAAADELAADNALLRSFLAEQLDAARGDGREDDVAARSLDHERAATGLLALAEGLGVQVLTSGLPAEDALAALHSQLDLTFATSP